MPAAAAASSKRRRADKDRSKKSGDTTTKKSVDSSSSKKSADAVSRTSSFESCNNQASQGNNQNNNDNFRFTSEPSVPHGYDSRQAPEALHSMASRDNELPKEVRSVEVHSVNDDNLPNSAEESISRVPRRGRFANRTKESDSCIENRRATGLNPLERKNSNYLLRVESVINRRGKSTTFSSAIDENRQQQLHQSMPAVKLNQSGRMLVSPPMNAHNSVSDVHNVWNASADQNNKRISNDDLGRGSYHTYSNGSYHEDRRLRMIEAIQENISQRRLAKTESRRTPYACTTKEGSRRSASALSIWNASLELSFDSDASRNTELGDSDEKQNPNRLLTQGDDDSDSNDDTNSKLLETVEKQQSSSSKKRRNQTKSIVSSDIGYNDDSDSNNAEDSTGIGSAYAEESITSDFYHTAKEDSMNSAGAEDNMYSNSACGCLVDTLNDNIEWNNQKNSVRIKGFKDEMGANAGQSVWHNSLLEFRNHDANHKSGIRRPSAKEVIIAKQNLRVTGISTQKESRQQFAPSYCIDPKENELKPIDELVEPPPHMLSHLLLQALRNNVQSFDRLELNRDFIGCYLPDLVSALHVNTSIRHIFILEGWIETLTAKKAKILLSVITSIPKLKTLSIRFPSKRYHLSISKVINNISPLYGVTTSSKMSPASDLRRLKLWGVELRRKRDVLMLSNALPTLLNLKEFWIYIKGDVDLHPILRGLCNCCKLQVAYINTAGSDKTTSGVNTLADLCRAPKATLQTLSLNNINMNEEQMDNFLPVLIYKDHSSPKSSLLGSKEIYNNRSLQWLSINDIELEDDHIVMIANILKTNTVLRWLTLQDVGLLNKHCIEIAASLENNFSLLKLDITMNERITRAGYECFVKLLRQPNNDTLQLLLIDDTDQDIHVEIDKILNERKDRLSKKFAEVKKKPRKKKKKKKKKHRKFEFSDTASTSSKSIGDSNRSSGSNIVPTLKTKITSFAAAAKAVAVATKASDKGFASAVKAVVAATKSSATPYSTGSSHNRSKMVGGDTATSASGKNSFASAAKSIVAANKISTISDDAKNKPSMKSTSPKKTFSAAAKAVVAATTSISSPEKKDGSLTRLLLGNRNKERGDEEDLSKDDSFH